MSPGTKTRRRRFLIVAILLILFSTVGFSLIKNIFVTNLGWVYLMRGYPAFADAPTSKHAEEWFARADYIDGSAPLGYWLGYGTAAIHRRQMDVAWQRWQQGGVPYQNLAAPGAIYASSLGDWQSAINFEMGADIQADAVGAPATHVGALCQSIRTKAQEYLGQYAEYCEKFVRENGQNLLINGNFALDPTHGWSFFPSLQISGLEVTKEADENSSEPAIKLVFPPANSVPNQICQYILLNEGEEVQFQAEIKVDLAASTLESFRPLYIAWVQNGSVEATNVVPLLSSGWNHYVRTFQLPPDSNERVLFCPVMISDSAEIWLANVQVTTLSRNDSKK